MFVATEMCMVVNEEATWSIKKLQKERRTAWQSSIFFFLLPWHVKISWL